MNSISIVVPVYNEEEVLNTSYDKILQVAMLSKLDYEIIFVDDGSKDNSLNIIRELSEKNSNVKYISFSKNFGHQTAIFAGIEKSIGDAVVTIDADLQDNPIHILDMIILWQRGYDVVYGKRVSRKGETVFKKVTAMIYYRVLNFLAEEKIPKDTGDFRLMDRKVVEELKNLKEKSKYLRGLIAWLGYKQISLEYVREERLKGKSKYSLKKMINLALDGIVGFSYKPIRYITVLGGFISIISVLVFIILLSVYLKGVIDISSIYISGAIFLVGFHFLSLGVIGEYVAQIHKEVKNRPIYISKEER